MPRACPECQCTSVNAPPVVLIVSGVPVYAKCLTGAALEVNCLKNLKRQVAPLRFEPIICWVHSDSKQPIPAGCQRLTGAGLLAVTALSGLTSLRLQHNPSIQASHIMVQATFPCVQHLQLRSCHGCACHNHCLDVCWNLSLCFMQRGAVRYPPTLWAKLSDCKQWWPWGCWSMLKF